MNDFLLIIFKGLYPLYFFFLVFGVIHRIKCRKWNSFDTLLLSAFFLFEFLAAFQVPFFYGILSTSKRYLWIGLPFSLPFAAEGLRRLLKYSFMKKFAAFICIVLIGVNIYNVYSPIIHGKHSTGKNAEQAISRDVAEWIKKDWKPRTSSPIAVFKCDRYQSGKRPLVQSEFRRIGYLCGGQDYPAFFSSRNIMPDYIVSRSPAENPDFVPVNEISQIRIYKNRKICP